MITKLTTVIDVNEKNDIIAEFEEGGYCYIPLKEVSRRPWNKRLDWMIGKPMRVMPVEDAAPIDGYPVYSGKAYEELVYTKVVDDFNAKRKNVYRGTLVSVKGYNAWINIAPGINGRLNIANLCFAHLPHAYEHISLPKHMPVVIKNINTEREDVELSVKPGWLGFGDSIEKLQLREGSIVAGMVCSKTPGGSNLPIVMIAPNCTVLSRRRAAEDVPVEIGDYVRVQVVDIDVDQRRARADIIERIPPFQWDFERFQAEIEGDWFDLQAFEATLRPVKEARPERPEPATEISFELPAREKSPFTVNEGETCVHNRVSFVHSNNILSEMSKQHLNDTDKIICKGINELRYSNQYILLRYLSLKFNTPLAEATIKNALKKLTRLNIISSFRYKSADGEMTAPIFMPASGYNFKTFMGIPARICGWEMNNEDPFASKAHLAGNQLLLSMLRNYPVVEHDPHPYLLHNEGDEEIRIKPLHKLVFNGTAYYLEAMRGADFSGYSTRLQKYNKAFAISGEKAEVLVAVSTPEQAEEYARITEQELGLDCRVKFCADLETLPTPRFHIAEAGKCTVKEPESIGSRISKLFSSFAEKLVG